MISPYHVTRWAERAPQTGLMSSWPSIPCPAWACLLSRAVSASQPLAHTHPHTTTMQAVHPSHRSAGHEPRQPAGTPPPHTVWAMTGSLPRHPRRSMEVRCSRRFRRLAACCFALVPASLACTSCISCIYGEADDFGASGRRHSRGVRRGGLATEVVSDGVARTVDGRSSGAVIGVRRAAWTTAYRRDARAGRSGRLRPPEGQAGHVRLGFQVRGVQLDRAVAV